MIYGMLLLQNDIFSATVLNELMDRYVNTSLPITYVNSNRNKKNFFLSIVEGKAVKEIFSLGLGFICFTKPSLVKVLKTLCICVKCYCKVESVFTRNRILHLF